MAQSFRKCVVCYIIVMLISDSQLTDAAGRRKRSVVYPKGGTFKIVVGIAIPVKLGLKQSMSASVNLQAQYGQATNASQLHEFPPIVARSRDKRENRVYSDRSLAYLGLESLLNGYNVNGHVCLLRSICENSMDSLHHSSNGLFGHLMHIFLTPDYGDGETDDDLDPDYVDAQEAGRYGVDCASLYPNCPYGHGILDMISIFDV